MTQKKLSEKLAELIDNSIQKYCVPIQKGNSVRIKHLVVRKNKHSHLVIDLRYHKQVATFFSKTGAIACASSLADGINRTAECVKLDRELQEKYLECINFKNILENSKEEEYKQTATIRYQIAWDDLNTIKQALLDIVFDK